MTAQRGVVLVVLTAVIFTGCASASAPSVNPAPSPVTPSLAPGVGGAGSPGPSVGADLARSFLERVRDPDARYRVDETLTVVIGQATSKAVSHSDVDGADMMVISDSTVGGTTKHSEYLQVGGAAFDRSAGGDWHATGPADARQTPFPFIEAANMQYAGRQIKDGEFLESLSLAKAIPIGTPVAESLGVTGGSASIVLFHAFLQADGSPVRVEVGFQLTGADGSAAGYGTIAQDYADFGGDVVVKPSVS
jgi:hypothetical protein